MNLPNKITVFRMFVSPAFLICYLLSIPHHYLIATLVFVIGAVTDALDGRIARKRNIVTDFGKLLDPIADKMLVTACMLGLMKDGMCNIWFVMIMLTREFTITSYRLIASTQGVVIPANIFGKIKTVMQMVFSILIMVMCEANEVFSLNINMPLISNILMGLTTVMCAVSGIIYIVQGSKLVHISK